MLDMDLVLIFTFITIVTTITGFTINAIVGKVLAHRRWERENSLTGTRSSAQTSELAERTELIEDRVRVLERLATDRGQLLSDEIEALRDERSAREKEAS